MTGNLIINYGYYPSFKLIPGIVNSTTSTYPAGVFEASQYDNVSMWIQANKDDSGKSRRGLVLYNYSAKSNPAQALALRQCDTAGTWQSDLYILHSGNYTNYTVTKTGEGANGTWNINITGSAAKWTTPRKITLSGDITGNTTFDGSTDITLSAAAVSGLTSVSATQPTEDKYTIWIDTSEDTGNAMRADAIKYKTFSIATTAWSGSGPYTYNIAATGVTTNTAIINLTLDAASQTYQKAQLNWETGANVIILSTAIKPTGIISGYLITAEVTVI